MKLKSMKSENSFKSKNFLNNQNTMAKVRYLYLYSYLGWKSFITFK